MARGGFGSLHFTGLIVRRFHVKSGAQAREADPGQTGNWMSPVLVPPREFESLSSA